MPKSEFIQPSEKSIQNALARHCLYRLQHKAVCPNIFLFRTGESDLVSVTKSHYAVEYEIKISRSDFFADQKKEFKHSALRDALDTNKPTYFWYACPHGLVSINEVPAYAGLIYVSERFSEAENRNYKKIDVIKRAPKLHGEKITSDHALTISRGLMFRYWDIRLGATHDL